MNDLFNLNRFFQYALKHYSENGKKYIIMMITAFLLLTSINYTILKTLDQSPASLLYPLLFCCTLGVLLILVVQDMTMRGFRKRNTCITEYLFPASDIEKYIFGIINPILIFVIYTGLCYLSLYIVQLFTDIPLNIIHGLQKISSIPSLITFFIAAQAFAIFSTVLSRKNPLQGYLITMLGIILFYSILSIPIWLGLINETSGLDLIPYLSISPEIEHETDSVMFYISRVSYDWKQFVELIFVILTTFIFWIAGYFRFKSRELK